MELAVMLVAFVALGVLRPRWTSLLAAVVPAGLACGWLFLHEDIPGEETGFEDVVWYVGMGAGVGVVFAVACACGLVVRRAMQARHTRSSLR